MKLARFNQKKLNFKFSFDIIQLSKLLYCGNSSGVEHNLAKVGVASSNLVSRSIFSPGGGMVDTRDLKSLGNYFRAGSSPALGTTSIWRHGQVVRQKPAKLLPPVRIWVSPPYFGGLIALYYFAFILLLYGCSNTWHGVKEDSKSAYERSKSKVNHGASWVEKKTSN